MLEEANYFTAKSIKRNVSFFVLATSDMGSLDKSVTRAIAEAFVDLLSLGIEEKVNNMITACTTTAQHVGVILIVTLIVIWNKNACVTYISNFINNSCITYIPNFSKGFKIGYNYGCMTMKPLTWKDFTSFMHRIRPILSNTGVKTTLGTLGATAGAYAAGVTVVKPFIEDQRKKFAKDLVDEAMKHAERDTVVQKAAKTAGTAAGVAAVDRTVEVAKDAIGLGKKK